ncbi:unnamed protein product [Adineta ricciae]|uniref:ARID domain-containing protein n=2 Tax=Adineta ricciae TaxID=249248 RepID=A0A814E2E0_ADIRI|nr:unnamed protein product [Adineta ricciae]
MHGERDGRTLSSPPPSMLTDETAKNDINTNSSSTHTPPTELAYLPIGCSVSAKYRGAFCSAQVKAFEKQVKLKVTLVDSGDTITISEEQIVHPTTLRIGNTVTIRLNPSNRRQSNDSNSHQHYSRSGLAAFINPTNPDEKQATIKQIIDNSLYTVVFNDGDEKSLRRSSLCLQGVRLYQNQYGQQKILEEIPTTTPTASISPPPPPPSSSSTVTPSTDTTNANPSDVSTVVAIKRQGNNDQNVFPAIVLKRKALADYMWVRSFVDGREYIVHTRDDVQPYHNNQDIQALCRASSKQATQACEKFIKYNQIPAVWQKKKRQQQKSDNKNTQSDEENSSESESSSSESDDDDDDEIDEETAEEKDSFVAQLFAFMDDRGTPINNIPKVQNYDLDLHRLFKLVRLYGGFNKVTKNDQWETIHIKMGLPDEVSTENGRSIEQAYRKYLFAYEDLSKKLGSMNAPSAYFGGRTSMGSDSRRSLIRARQQQQHEEEKNQKKTAKSKQSPASVKQRSRKSNESQASVDSKATSTAKKSIPKSPITPNRKGPNKSKPSNVISSSSSESESESETETSDDESSRSSSSHCTKSKAKPAPSQTPSKKSTVSSSAIPKKTNPPSTSSTSTSTKTDAKKASGSTKPVSSSSSASNVDSKQSKLTITIPIAKPKAQSSSSSSGQPVKKVTVTSSNKDDKKKVPDIKSVPIKSEPKSISSSLTKKPVISPAKSSQITKTSQQQKNSSNELSKSSTTVPSNKTPSSLLPFKPKTTHSQTSTNNNNNNNNNSKDRTGLSKPSSSSSSSSSTTAKDLSRHVKSTKFSASSTKTTSQERSASTPVKKTKPTGQEDSITKPISAAPTMKIPKISSNTDPTKKPTTPIDKIPKKQVLKEGTSKIPKIQDSSSTNKSHTAGTQTKPSLPSPTRPAVSESTKKTTIRDVSPVSIPPVSPSPPPPPATAVPSNTDAATADPTPASSIQNTSTPTDPTPEVKLPEAPLALPVSSTTMKESNENDTPATTSNKRSHSDENSEPVFTSSSVSEAEEQLSPSKRARRSISSQESTETFSSNNDQPTTTDTISANRNTQLTYDDIFINDILLVTWGNHGTKQYPARCIEKNDDKKELFVHYTGWNSRHDEWVKLDRVIERKDTTNTNTLFQQRPRRTSQINTLRQQHLDSTTSSNSNEQNNPQQVTSSTSADLTSSSTLIDDDLLHKNSKPISVEKAKTEESDTDDNSQSQHENWPNVETISSTDDDALSSASTVRTSQSDTNRLPTDEPTNIRRSISVTKNENILSTPGEFEATDDNDIGSSSVRDDDHVHATIPKRRQSRAASSNNKVDSTSTVKTEQVEEPFLAISDIHEHPHQYPFYVKEETIDSSSISQQTIRTPFIAPTTSLLADTISPLSNILSSPPLTATGNRRASVRQQKRRTLREPNSTKDTSASAKKRTKLDHGAALSIDLGGDNNSNGDQTPTRSNSTEQQASDNATNKRHRTAGRRGGKRSANQPEYENEDYRSSSPSNMTMRQQLKDMFKHRPSRYNFLDLNNNLTGDERITHLKDRMRDCQKVFFNLKSALVKIEKQRKAFLRKQKPILSAASGTIIQSTPTEILGTSTCT